MDTTPSGRKTPPHLRKNTSNATTPRRDEKPRPAAAPRRTIVIKQEPGLTAPGAQSTLKETATPKLSLDGSDVIKDVSGTHGKDEQPSGNRENTLIHLGDDEDAKEDPTNLSHLPLYMVSGADAEDKHGLQEVFLPTASNSVKQDKVEQTVALKIGESKEDKIKEKEEEENVPFKNIFCGEQFRGASGSLHARTGSSGRSNGEGAAVVSKGSSFVSKKPTMSISFQQPSSFITPTRSQQSPLFQKPSPFKSPIAIRNPSAAKELIKAKDAIDAKAAASKPFVPAKATAQAITPTTTETPLKDNNSQRSKPKLNPFAAEYTPNGKHNKHEQEEKELIDRAVAAIAELGELKSQVNKQNHSMNIVNVSVKALQEGLIGLKTSTDINHYAVYELVRGVQRQITELSNLVGMEFRTQERNNRRMTEAIASLEARIKGIVKTINERDGASTASINAGELPYAQIPLGRPTTFSFGARQASPIPIGRAGLNRNFDAGTLAKRITSGSMPTQENQAPVSSAYSYSNAGAKGWVLQPQGIAKPQPPGKLW